MPLKFTFTSEADALAHIEALQGQVAKLTTDHADVSASLATVTGERDKAKTDLATAQSANAALTTERDSLKGENATLKSDNERMKGEVSDFNGKLASELAKHGIRKEALKTGAENKSDKPMTATEKLLAARGVSSIEELSVKRTK